MCEVSLLPVFAPDQSFSSARINARVAWKPAAHTSRAESRIRHFLRILVSQTIAATQFLARTTKRPRGADPPRRTPALTSPCANRIRRGRTNLLKSLANVWRRLELSGMRRRELIALLGGAVVGWPLAVCAQHGGVPVVGFLHYASPNKLTHLADAFRRGLQETGYIAGQNVVIEYRWAEGQYDRLPALAADLVHRQVSVIAAGGSVAAQAAKNATTTIPVVFTSGADPVATGLVASLSRPGGNVSGMSLLAAEMATKRLELIRDLLPRARAIAMITNPAYPGSHSEMAEVEAAGRSVGMQTHRVAASSPAGDSADEVPTCDQPEDSEGARSHGAAIDPRPRR